MDAENNNIGVQVLPQEAQNFTPPPQVGSQKPSINYSSLPTITQEVPEAVNLLMGNDPESSIDFSPIMNPDVTIPASTFEAVRSSVISPTFFVNQQFGVQGLKIDTSNTLKLANQYLSSPKSYNSTTEELGQTNSSAIPGDPILGFAGIKSTNTNSGDPKGVTTRTGGGVANFKNDFIAAIGGQESNNNYSAVNKDSGALGKYQVMPANILNNVKENWGLQALGRMVNPKEFLESPDIQEKIANFKLSEFYERAKSSGLSDEDSAKYASTSWYSGENKTRIKDGKLVYLQTDLVKQGDYPSIKDYASQVVSKIKPVTDINKPNFDPAQSISKKSIEKLSVINKFYEEYKDKVLPNPEGSYWGECVSTVRSYYKKAFNIDVPVFGNAWQGIYNPVLNEQFEALDKNFVPQINDMFFMNKSQSLPYGHVGIVVGSPTKKNTVYIMESNWANDRTPSLREVPVSDISAVRRLKT